MKIALLLDSSEKNLTVGISSEGKVIDYVSYESWQRQSELMVKEIDTILKKNGCTRDDIASVSCAKGPGSYTGVRIALTIAKTVAFALNVPLYLSSSLEVLKKGDEPSLCLSNARGKRSYFGVYSNGECLVPDCIKDNSEVLAYIDEHPELTPCGDLGYLGLEGYRSDIVTNLAEAIDEGHVCENALGAKPIYLKDDYDQGKFKTIVRRTIPSDLSSIMAIENASIKNPYSEQQMLYELTENPVAYLYSAVVDSEVVGFIDFMITFNSATITQIAVKEEFRSKGIGNLLLGQMLKDCRAQAEPVEYITLEVRQSNVRAQKFYKKHKFEQIVVKKSYYDDGEDAIYMVRSIISDV